CCSYQCHMCCSSHPKKHHTASREARNPSKCLSFGFCWPCPAVLQTPFFPLFNGIFLREKERKRETHTGT
ncbi:hypothetical protein E3U43_005456, partial [Larimichthys crocea]